MVLGGLPVSHTIEGDNKTSVGVQFALLHHFSMSSFTAAVDTLVTANLVHPDLYACSTTGLGSSVIKSDIGIDVSTDWQIPRPPSHDGLGDNLKILVVCGGYRSSIEHAPDLSAYLKLADRRGLILCSLWNGAVHLSRAGLLDEQRCAVHPENHAYINEKFPKVELSTNNFVVTETRASCSGPVSSIEMMLGVIRRQKGEAVVRAIREIISCDKLPENQDSTPLRIVEDGAHPSLLRNAIQLMRSNLEEPLSVRELAALIGLSTRQLERVFQSNVETSPSRYYLSIRLNYARQLLMQSENEIMDVALASGFVSKSHFSNCFKKLYGTSPLLFRKSN